MPDRDDPRLRELALRLADMAPQPPPYPGNTPRPRRRSQLRRLGWALVGFAAVAVGIGLPVWLLAPDDGATRPVGEQTFEVPGPVELAVGDVVWPAEDTVGSPSGVAVMFAREVLGWRQASASEGETGNCVATPSGRGQSCWEASVAVTLTQPGVAPLELIMLPIGEKADGRLWAVMQVGPGYTTDRLEAAPGGGSRVPLPPVENAATADVTMRIAEQDDLVAVTADSQELAEGFIDSELVTDPEEVLTVLVRYRDAAGHVITAVGGPWNEFYEWPPPDGVVYVKPATEITRTDGLTLVVQDSNIGPCLEVRTEQGGMAGGCGADFEEPLSVDVGLVDGKSFVSGWAPAGTVELSMTFPDGEILSVTALQVVEGYEVMFFLASPAPSIGNEPYFPIEAIAYDSDGNTLATVTYGTDNYHSGP
jgi:hypothetical protein